MPRRSNTTAKEYRTQVLTPVRVTKAERDIIKRKARDAGLSQSEFQRRALLDGAVIVRGNAIDAKAVRQLGAIGNNVNQIARKLNRLNEGSAFVPELELDRLRGISATLEKLIDELI